MNALGLPRKDRAAFLCRVADRNQVIKLLTDELLYRLRPVAGNINTDFTHPFDSQRIDRPWLCAGAEHLKLVPGFVAKNAFSHLATGGIAGTENKNSFRVSHE